MPAIFPRATTEALGAAREALARAEWERAREAFAAAAALEETPEALEGLGASAQWLFDLDTLLPAWERAYQLYRERGDRRGAARLATLLGVVYSDVRGEQAIARGWLELARRLLEGMEASAEHGWLALYGGHFALFIERDAAEALRSAREVIAVARRLELLDLEVVGLALEGLVRVVQGEVEAGMRRLDEATAAAVAGQVTSFQALWNTCCYLISGCERVRDYDRAAQWCDKAAEVSARWGMRPLFAACRTHYASILIWRGAWADAEAQLNAATLELERYWSNNASAGIARLGELRRRQGRWEEAAALFARAEHHPIALLGRAAIALDRSDAGSAADLLERYLRRVPPEDRTERAPALELLVRLHLLRGDGDAARGAGAELREIAASIGTDPLRGASAVAHGLVATAEGDLEEARRAWEDASEFFDRARAPFEAALARTDLARVLRTLGRSAAARDAAAVAHAILEQLGATHYAEQAAALLDPPGAEDAAGDGPAPAPNPLTPRQQEVLRLVATGITDREIARRLFLSEFTVHRHVSNILLKLGVSSRSAAVAQALRQGIL